MEELIVSATEARKNFFTLLEKAASGKVKVVVVKRDSGQAVTWTPTKKAEKVSWKDQRKRIEGLFGTFKNDNSWEKRKREGRKLWLAKLKRMGWI